MHFIETLQARGLLQDIINPDGIKTLGPNDAFYCGFDPTAPSFQIGNLVPVFTMAHVAKGGLKCLCLFGGSTGLIGDPTGKKSERPLLPPEVVAANVERQVRQFTTIFDRLKLKSTFINNLDWTKDVKLLDFLREVGKHIPINYMLDKESVRNRLNSGDGYSYAEFTYMLLQAFDFLHLRQKYNCRLQLGGSDQWGNITAGVELVRRKLGEEVYALSAPLITDSQGRKFGKSEAGAVWLDPERTSPYQFHQFWINVEDKDVIRLLKIFTFLELDVIAEAEAALKTAPEKREAHKLLADSITTLVHGEAATELAKRSAAVLFGGSIDGLSEADLLSIFKDVPSTTITRSKLKEMSILDLYVDTKLSPSKGEARRLASSGGLYLNNEKAPDMALKLSESQLVAANILLLRSGKKNYHLVKIEN